MRAYLIFFGLLLVGPVWADEGMWTFDNFPTETVRARYGFAPDDKWLEHVRLASVRLAGGCSGSFVSAEGLVLTNHHCVHHCIEQLSTSSRDLVKDGYYARTQAEELRCPELEINQLVAIHDVTERIRKATEGLEGQRFAEALRTETSKIERECKTAPDIRCDVVSLYHGGFYHVYKYRRFDDVRLAFAPEFQAAFFGGDPDNFNFPRYNLDMALVRVYVGGRPLRTERFFRFAKWGAKEGNLVFVAGNPGGTSRQFTIAQLEYERDVFLPERLYRYAELRGLLTEFSRRGPEQARIAKHDLFAIENAFKALKGRFETLIDRRFFYRKMAEESELRKLITQDPERRRRYGGAFEEIERAVEKRRALEPLYRWVRPHPRRPVTPRFFSTLVGIAEALWRAGEERTKPDEKRLAEFREAQLPRMTAALFSEAPIHKDLEILNLGFALTKIREDLGPDHPFVKALLGKEAPYELAERAIRSTKLASLEERRRLWEGGRAAVSASQDPLIELVRRIDTFARASRKEYEEAVEAPLKRGGEKLARLRFELFGTKSYPDATFTPRLSFGRVRGYMWEGKPVSWKTDFGGAFVRDTGRPPFDLPPSWHKAKPKIDLRIPLNFCTDNDIIGGNSGSPVINRNLELVGLIFDGNLPHLGADYWYDHEQGRAVAVHSDGMIHALRVIYGAERLLRELGRE